MKLITFIFMWVGVMQGVCLIQIHKIFWLIAFPLWAVIGYSGAMMDDVLKELDNKSK